VGGCWSKAISIALIWRKRMRAPLRCCRRCRACCWIWPADLFWPQRDWACRARWR
jgi:Adenine specific DNA methylase Mod